MTNLEIVTELFRFCNIDEWLQGSKSEEAAILAMISNACETNGEPLEEGDCFKYMGSQVAADGDCEKNVVHRMNEG